MFYEAFERDAMEELNRALQRAEAAIAWLNRINQTALMPSSTLMSLYREATGWQARAMGMLTIIRLAQAHLKSFSSPYAELEERAGTVYTAMNEVAREVDHRLNAVAQTMV